MQLLAKQPENRPQSAEEVAEALAELAGEQTAIMQRPGRARAGGRLAQQPAQVRCPRNGGGGCLPWSAAARSSGWWSPWYCF